MIGEISVNLANVIPENLELAENLSGISSIDLLRTVYF